MNLSVTPRTMIDAYGLENLVFFPRYAESEPHAAALLSLVGLPNSTVFLSRTDPADPYDPGFDPVAVGSNFDFYGWGTCPEESRSWWMLGTLFETVIALDPATGRVYEFPDGESDYRLLHRDLESFLFTLIEFRRLETDHDAETLDPEALVERFTRVVGAFDPTPFAEEESQWNTTMRELIDEIW
ncbi:hypothetical protein SRB5_57720 [Streptomyces sp. RB5]|uniref:SUKH-4 immunity protein n=1 Tax=Streptomyces smaragdinus TaxID=2585196 RepID=A0A7K0CQ37_9ACTN|nr:SUKH-4 family immunity protein [Streptomyces smaragdinus]MQY15588.1 hypothetical protein [Streptomyces smaragdinus]